MNIAIKKAGASVLAMVFAVAAVSSANTASATTVEELQALIAQLTAQVAALSGSTTNATTTTTGYVHSGVTKDFTFSLLKVGSKGEEVKALQSVINTGADGNFGPGTKAALMAWQAANGLVADGIAGAATRVELNRMSSITTSTGTTSDSSSEVEGDMLAVEGWASDDLVVGINQKVTFLKLELTAGDEDVKVEDIELEFRGTGDRSDLDKVTVLDETKSEIDSDTFNSDDEATVDADLEIEAGETAVLYIGAVTDGTFSGNGLDISVKVTDIMTDGADVDDTSFVGAVHEINSSASTDEYDAEISRKESSAKIGEDEVRLAEINISNDENSDQFVKSIKLQRVGTGDSDDTLGNVYIDVDGDMYEAMIDTDDDDEYIFDFGNGIVLEEDEDIDFEIFADIEDDATATVAFDIIDITIEDEDGILLKEKDGGDSANAGEWTYGSFLTVADTDVTISETSDADDDKVAAGTTDVELQSFEVEVTGEDIEADVNVTFDITVGTIASDASDLEMENVAIYTSEGSKISSSEDVTFTVTAAAATESITVTFDNVVFEEDEDPTDYMIMGDINEDATDGTQYVVSQIQFVNVETEDEDLSDVTEAVSGTNQTEIEVEGGVLTAEVSAPSPAEVNSDKDDVLIAEIELDAEDSGDDFNVSEINMAMSIAIGEITQLTVDTAATAAGNATISLNGAAAANVAVTVATADVNATEIATAVDAITGYSATASGNVVTIVSDSAANDTNTVFTPVVASLAVSQVVTDGGDSAARLAEVTNCELYNGDDKVSTSDEDASASMSFSVDVDVEKDTIVTLELFCDNSSTLANADAITVSSVTFDADADVTDVDYNNETASGTSVVTVAEGTLLAVLSSDDENDAKVEKESTNNVVLGVLEVEADDADITIDTLTANFNDNGAGTFTNFEGKVGLYVNDELVEDETLAATMTFTGLDIEVENNEKVDIEFRVDAEDTAPAVAVAEALTVTAITLEESGATGFTGSVALAEITVVEAVPVITQIDVDTSELETDNDVVLFAYKVEADGEDVTIGSTLLEGTLSNVTLANMQIEVYDNASRNGTAEVEVALTQAELEAGTAKTITSIISDGDTYYVFLVADVDVTDTTRSVRITMQDDPTGVVFTTPAITGDLLLDDELKSLLKED